MEWVFASVRIQFHYQQLFNLLLQQQLSTPRKWMFNIKSDRNPWIGNYMRKIAMHWSISMTELKENKNSQVNQLFRI